MRSSDIACTPPRLVGPAPVVDDSISVHASMVSAEPTSDALVATWLGSSGFVLGYAGGQISNVQAANMSLDGLSAGTLVNVTTNGVNKVVSLQETTETKGYGSASDSFI